MLSRATVVLMAAMFFAASAVSQSSETEQSDGPRARALLVVESLRANDLTAAEQHLDLFKKTGSPELAARLEKAIAGSRASADAAAKVASRLKELDFQGAVAASEELGTTGVRRCLLAARFATIAGRFEEAEHLLTNCATRDAERPMVEKEQEQLATTKSESLKLRKELDEFLYSGLAVSNWLYCYPELKGKYRIADYLRAVEAASALTPMDRDVINHTLFAAMMAGDYASFKRTFDTVAKGSPVVRIPAFDGKAHSDFVIDMERREFRYERLERSFDVQFNEKSQPLNIGRPVGCALSHSGGLHYNRSVKPSEPWTVQWDQVKEISNHSAIMTGRSFALRLNESNFIPALKVVYTDLDPLPIGLYARNAWRNLSQLVADLSGGKIVKTVKAQPEGRGTFSRMTGYVGSDTGPVKPPGEQAVAATNTWYDDFSKSIWQLSIDELLAGVSEELALLP